MAAKDAEAPVLKVLAEAESSHRKQRGGRGESAWPDASALPPLPAGELVQGNVRADYIDLRRTFVSLGHDELSGYVRLCADDTSAAALLSAGGVVAAMCEQAGEVTSGTEAFNRMRRSVDAGQGTLEIVRLPEVVLSATHQMVAGPVVYTGLRGSFLRGAEFIDYMSESKLTGGIQVSSEGRHGVVLLHDGIVGAYTGRSPRPNTALDAVMELFADPLCQVSVTGGAVGATLPLMIL